MRETLFCNDHMFQCITNGLCIIPHYVCDGKEDCKDGSDETLATCNGDPCRGNEIITQLNHFENSSNNTDLMFLVI